MCLLYELLGDAAIFFLGKVFRITGSSRHVYLIPGNLQSLGPRNQQHTKASKVRKRSVGRVEYRARLVDKQEATSDPRASDFHPLPVMHTYDYLPF